MDVFKLWELGSLRKEARASLPTGAKIVHLELGSRFIRFCAQKFYFRRDWELFIKNRVCRLKDVQA
jgi:hypothetical protein